MKFTFKSILSAGVAVLGLLATATSVNAQNVISFGDSLSDNGNLFATNGTPPAPYFNGRFSNGQTWAELLAGGAQNSPIQGTGVNGNVNVAFGGARSGSVPNVNNAPPIPSVTTQIGIFQGNGGTIAANDIVTVWGGANDILDFFDTNPGGANDPTQAGFILPNSTTIQANSVQAATNMVNNIATLAGMGARTIVVPNLPNIGATPAFNGTATGAQGGQLASGAFNTALSQGLDALQAGLPAGTRIIRVDTSRIFNEIIANGSTFGFSNVTASCVATIACVTGSTAVQNQNLFWDGVHPTAAGHVLFSQIVQTYLAFAAQAPAAAALTESVMWARRDSADSIIDRANGHITGSGEVKKGGYIELAGATGKQKARAGRSAYDYTTYGVRLGADVPMNNLVFGGAIGILFGNIGGGTIKADQYHLQADLYALATMGNFFFKAAAGVGGGHLNDIKRSSGVAGFINSADTNTFQTSVSGEAGMQYDLGSFKIMPAARIDYVYGQVRGFSESGAVAPLQYSNLSSSGVFGALKVRAATDFGAGQAYGEVGYEELLAYKFKGRAGLAGSPGTSVAFNVADPRAKGFFAKLGLSGQFSDNIKTDVSYAIALQNGKGTSHAGKIRVSIALN